MRPSPITRPITRPIVGVSQCLMGDAVRYDGQSKANQKVLTEFARLFELIPICPEVEAGLSIPRPPVQLSDNIEKPKLIGRDDPDIDVTKTLSQYCHTKPDQLTHLCGYIFKCRSPSCGLNSTPVFIDGVEVTNASRGVFARAIIERYPQLPVIEDSALTEQVLADFIKQVKQYHLKSLSF